MVLYLVAELARLEVRVLRSEWLFRFWVGVIGAETLYDDCFNLLNFLFRPDAGWNRSWNLSDNALPCIRIR